MADLAQAFPQGPNLSLGPCFFKEWEFFHKALKRRRDHIVMLHCPPNIQIQKYPIFLVMFQHMQKNAERLKSGFCSP